MGFPSQKAPVLAQPLIAVRNVRASSRWYAKLLGADPLPENSRRDAYERISCSGQLLLQLHAWDEENHPQHREIWLRYADGYAVVVASPDGERGS